MSDDAKKAILARRAKFVAAAIAGLGVACGKERAAACLSIAAPAEDAGPASPQPCLSAWSGSTPPVWNQTSTPDAGDPVMQADVEPDGGPMPRPCLTPRVHDTEPRPCLSIAPPSRDAGRDDCSTPYWYDAHGVKRYKPQCMKGK